MCHLSHEASEVLVHHKPQKVLATLLVSGPVPQCRQHAGQYGGRQQLTHETQRQRLVTALLAPGHHRHEHRHHEAGQHDADRTFGERGRTHGENGPPWQLMAIALPPAVELIERTDNEQGEHHVDTAVGASAVHLKGGECEHGSQHAYLAVLAACIEHGTPGKHDDEGYG